MPSARHLELKRRSNALRKNLLPKKPSLSGSYTKRQLDGIAGYFVLVHAELESYLEDKALEITDISVKRWNSEKSLTKALFSMIAYYEGQRKGPPQSFDPDAFKDRRLETLVNAAVSQHKSRLRHNHGIREGNICEILFPIGFSHSDLDTTLIASLDSFGSRRGDFAHQSLRSVIAKTQIDPFIEVKTVENIVNELAKVDELFSYLAK